MEFKIRRFLAKQHIIQRNKLFAHNNMVDLLYIRFANQIESLDNGLRKFHFRPDIYNKQRLADECMQIILRGYITNYHEYSQKMASVYEEVRTKVVKKIAAVVVLDNAMQKCRGREEKKKLLNKVLRQNLANHQCRLRNGKIINKF